MKNSTNSLRHAVLTLLTCMLLGGSLLAQQADPFVLGTYLRHTENVYFFDHSDLQGNTLTSKSWKLYYAAFPSTPIYTTSDPIFFYNFFSNSHPTGDYIVELTINTSGGSSTATENFTVYGTSTGSSNLYPNPISGPSEVCAGEEFTLNPSVIGGYASTWNDQDGNVYWAGNLTTTESTPGVYFYRIETATYGTGSPPGIGDIYVGTKIVTVHTNPVADAGPNLSACAGDAVNIGGSPTGTGANPLSYSWSGPGGFSSMVANPTVTASSSGNFTVTVTDGNGCAASDAAFLTVNPLPTADAGADQIVCSGTTVTIGGSPTGTGSGLSYAWSPATHLGGTETSANPSYTNSTSSGDDPTTYTVTVTGQGGCTATDQVTITSHKVEADAGADLFVCSGSDADLSVNVINGTAPVSFAWTPSGNLNFPASQAPTASNITAQTTYTVQVTDAHCVVSDDVVVTPVSAPSINSVTPSAATCPENCNGSIALNVTTDGAVTPQYTWTGGLSGQNPSAVCGGSYNVTLSYVEVDNGCETTQNNIVVNAPSMPVPTLTPSQSLCSNGNCTGSIATTNNASSSFGTSFDYDWSNGSTAQNPSALCAAVYTVTVTSNLGCIATQVTAIGAQYDIQNAIVAIDENCENQGNGTITVTPSGSSGSNYNYAWATLASTNNAPSDFKENLHDGTYHVTVTGVANQCEAYSTVTLNPGVDPEWPVQTDINLNGTSTDIGNDIAVSRSGLVFIVGEFQGTSEMGGNPMQSGGSSVDGMFVACLDECGNTRWLNYTYGDASNFAKGHALVIDETNSRVYVVGTKTGSPMLITDNAVPTLSGTGSMFLAGFDFNGNSTNLYYNNSLGTPNPTSIDINPSNNNFVVVGGNSTSQVFLLYLTSNWGIVSLQTSTGGATGDILNDVEVDGNGYAYVVGTKQNGTTLAFPGITDLISTSANSDAFVEKINLATFTGTVIRQANASTGFSATGMDLVLDDGNVYVTGAKNGPMSAMFGSGSLSSMGPNMYVSSISTSSMLANWHRDLDIASSPLQYATGNSIDLSEGIISVAGGYTGGAVAYMDFSGSTQYIYGNANQNRDLFVLELQTNGTFSNGTVAYGLNFGTDIGLNNAIASGPFHSFQTGSYSGSFVFPIVPNNGVTSVPSNSNAFASRVLISSGSYFKTGNDQDMSLNAPAIEALTMEVYPNPNDGQFQISLVSSSDEVSVLNVFDVFGRVVKVENLSGSFKSGFMKTINLPDATPGLYFVQVIQGDVVVSKQIIIQ